MEPPSGGGSVVTPPLSTMLDDLARLTREASRLAEVVSGARADGLTPQQRLLLRLVAGHAEDQDAAAPDLVGARLMFARGADVPGLPTVFSARHPDVWAAPVQDGALVALVRRPVRLVDDSATHAAAAAVAAALRSHDVTVTVGVSSPLPGVTGLPEAYREAADAADLAGRGALPLVFADEQWAELALLRVRRGFRHTLPIANPIERLHAHDREKGSDLARTLYTWLVNNGEVAATAGSLQLHPNTLRYRLRRAAEVAGFDLASPEHRLLLHLGLGTTCEASPRE